MTAEHITTVGAYGMTEADSGYQKTVQVKRNHKGELIELSLRRVQEEGEIAVLTTDQARVIGHALIAMAE